LNASQVVSEPGHREWGLREHAPPPSRRRVSGWGGGAGAGLQR
jgi:hypothetical protein